MKKVLVSITTINNVDWRSQIKEANKLKLKEVAVFVTGLNKKQRQEMYRLLENSSIKSIPFVHLRGDMGQEELDYLIKKFKTKVFNIHSKSEFPQSFDYSEKYRKMIFIENVYNLFKENEIKRFGGICLDFSHLENDRILKPEKFKKDVELIEKYPIGCNHASCLAKSTYRDAKRALRHDRHLLRKLSQMDYLKKYPKRYFSQFIAIELGNTVKQQLKVRDYIMKKILN
jgi:hypothetical protein